MFMPKFKVIRNEYEEVISSLGDGENTYGTPFSIKPSESRYSRNLCSDKYPAMAHRKYRSELIPSIGNNTFYSLGQRNSQYLHYQKGTVWYYWNSSIKQKDTMTLAGTGGTALITRNPGVADLGGTVYALITFSSDLTTTAANFVTASAASYALEGITLTSSANTLIFESIVAGKGHPHPVLTDATVDLVGTVVNTVYNETTVKDTLTAAVGRIEEFNTGTTRYTLLFNGTDRYSWDGSTATSLTNAPLTNKFTVHKGRVYALLGSELKFSALNLITDWTTANDAGSISITNAKGDATAIITYNDYVTIWTKYSMHQLFGTGPTGISAYELKDIETNVGCVSDRSVVICNGILYWVWYDGFYMFDGTLPKKISHKMDWYFNSLKDHDSVLNTIACGVQGDSIFISLPFDDLVIKYDTKNNTWYPWDETEYTAFTILGNILFGIETNGELINTAGTYNHICQVEDENATNDNHYFSSSPTGYPTFEWHSGPRIKNSVSKNKALQELWLVYEFTGRTSYGEINIYISTLSGTDDYANDAYYNNWTLVKTISPSTFLTTRERIIIPNSYVSNEEWYRIKISGYGYVIFHYIEEKYRVK